MNKVSKTLATKEIVRERNVNASISFLSSTIIIACSYRPLITEPIIVTKDTNSAKIHKQVCIRLKKDDYILYDRHFDSKDLLVPNMTRESIDILKKYFRPKLNMDDWKLTNDIKQLLSIK